MVNNGYEALSTGYIRKVHRVEEDVLTLARRRVREAFALFDTCMVSFSGGKDSTVVLNLAIEAARELGRLPVSVVFYDEEAIPFETEDYVRRCIARHAGEIEIIWLCIPIRHRNACTRKSPYWFPWAPEDEAKWVRPLPPEAVTTLEGFPTEPADRLTMPDSVGLLFKPPGKYGRVGMLMGIRSQESITRARAVLMSSRDSRPWIRAWEDGTATRGVIFKVYPIYDWRTEDVWTAPDEFGWDYNRAYDVMELAGLSHMEQRCAPPYGEEPMKGLWTYQVCFPNIWDKMSSRVPGAATAARYSRTELYSFGSRPQRPPGMTWPEFIRHWIDKHPAEYRGEIAKRVRDWIDVHFSKTAEPIAARASHPVTGMSWEFLLMIAVRGDFKDRKQPPMAARGNADVVRRKYDQEISEMRARGELS